ncbi:calcium/proton exchanger, partial [Flavobacterium enshiense]|uniref:calcium/proton exchanger n=1 Tax=Flavobacterium enshiense TaxID=1341165 RepID=UPI0005556CAA
MRKYLKPSVFWLFIFIPITIILEKKSVEDSLIFFSAALSIIPIAKLIGESTENLAHYTGDAIGGLLNATFGNAPELIIAIIALNAGMYQMVLASIAGAILANLLLATGVAFFIGGIKHRIQEYNPVTIHTYNSMMFLAVCSIIIPSAFHRFFIVNMGDVYKDNESSLNILLAIGLLVAYASYLFFMIKTHPDLFKSINKNADNRLGEEHKPWSKEKAIGALVAASVTAAFMSEILVGAAEGTGKELGMTPAFIGIVFVAVIGGAAESLSAIAMGAKNKVDLTIGIALGSSIQIALFVTPLLILLSFFIGPQPMFLNFNRAETGAMFMAVLLTTVVSNDGTSNWYKGIQMITLYMLIALLFYFIPEQT